LNKIFFIVFGLIAVASIAGLSTEFVNLNLQDFQFFGSFADFDEAFCTCEGDDGTFSKENCEQFGGDITDINGVCVLHPDVNLGDYGILPTNDQGCGVGFWNSNADEPQFLSIWPAGYKPNYYYNDLFKTTIGSENENKDKDENPLSKKDKDEVKDENKVKDKNLLSKKDKDEVKDENKLSKKDKDEVKDENKVRDENPLSKKDKDEVKDENKLSNEDKDEVRDENKLSKKDKDEVKDENKVRDENSEDDDTDTGLTLLEALNEKGGKMGHILRASVAALLNSAHSEVNYQYSVQEVISMTQDAINSENYQDAIDIFEELNEEGVRPPLCEDFDENSRGLYLDNKN